MPCERPRYPHMAMCASRGRSHAALAQLLRTRRLALGLLQTDVARRVGVDRACVSRWESGKAQPPPERHDALAATLEISREQLPEVAVQRKRPRPRRSACLRKRSRVRPLYPHSATLGQMLSLGGCALRVHEAARRKVGDDVCSEVARRFPRDTRHELLLAYHVLSRGARLVESAPAHRSCPIMILEDFEKTPGGDLRQPTLLWRGLDEVMALYGQVRVLGSGRRPYRLDFVVYYKRRGHPGAWMFVEVDGAPHLLTPNQDAERAEGIPVPEIRYDNEVVCCSDFFDRLVRDVRRKSSQSIAWARERQKRAREERRQREAQAEHRCSLP